MMHIIAALSAEFWTNFIIGVLTLAVGIAVLWITIVQFIETKRDETRRRQQQEEMDKRLQQITDLMSQGQIILQTSPEYSSAPTTAHQWMQSAEAWIIKTNEFLKGCSEQASIAFMDDVGTLDSAVTPNVFKSAQPKYQILNQRLKNLRSILDNQDVYLRPR